jgi:hypothetical protein
MLYNNIMYARAYITLFTEKTNLWCLPFPLIINLLCEKREEEYPANSLKLKNKRDWAYYCKAQPQKELLQLQYINP